MPLGVITHVEKIGRSRSKGENAYGLEVFCKVRVQVVPGNILIRVSLREGGGGYTTYMCM